MGVYNIGTKAGYDISESLKKNLGTSTTVSDGSSWTADKSGNIWVTKDGVTTKANITYQPTGPGYGRGSGGSSGGAGSGGAGSGGAGSGATAEPTTPAQDWSTPGGSGSSSTVDSAAGQRDAYNQQIQDYLKQLEAMRDQKTPSAVSF